MQFPGLAGGIESFATWERADWGLGCDIRDAKEPHWTGTRASRRDALALRRVGHADVGRPAGRRRPRVPRQPRHLLRLDDAPRPLGRPVRPRARGGGVRDWAHCPRCAAALERAVPAGDDEERLLCPACGLVLYENPAPTASAVVVDARGRVMLTRRGIEPFRGMWDLPGRVHPPRRGRGGGGRGASSREETGLEIGLGRVLAIVPDTYGADGDSDAERLLPRPRRRAARRRRRRTSPRSPGSPRTSSRRRPRSRSPASAGPPSPRWRDRRNCQ